MRTIAIRNPSGYASIKLDRDLHDYEEFESVYAMPAIVNDLISEGDIVEISGSFTEMTFGNLSAARHNDLEEMMSAMHESTETLSIYDAVGCVSNEIAGWNLLASEGSQLEIARQTKSPWIHLKIGHQDELPIAA